MKKRGELPTGYLTQRELEVWRLIAHGFVTKQIAEEFGCGIKCIEKHRGELYRKLAAGNLADLVRMAVQYGAITVAVNPLRATTNPNGRTSYELPDYFARCIPRPATPGQGSTLTHAVL